LATDLLDHSLNKIRVLSYPKLNVRDSRVLRAINLLSKRRRLYSARATRDETCLASHYANTISYSPVTMLISDHEIGRKFAANGTRRPKFLALARNRQESVSTDRLALRTWARLVDAVASSHRDRDLDSPVAKSSERQAPLANVEIMIGDDSLGLLAAPREPTAAGWRGAAAAAAAAAARREEERAARGSGGGAAAARGGAGGGGGEGQRVSHRRARPPGFSTAAGQERKTLLAHISSSPSLSFSRSRRSFIFIRRPFILGPFLPFRPRPSAPPPPSRSLARPLAPRRDDVSHALPVTRNPWRSSRMTRRASRVPRFHMDYHPPAFRGARRRASGIRLEDRISAGGGGGEGRRDPGDFSGPRSRVCWPRGAPYAIQ